MKFTRSTIVLCLIFAVGCAEQKQATEEVDLGTFKGSAYQNEYFGMRVTLPPDWDIQDQEARQEMMEMGSKAVAGDDKNLKAAIDAAEDTTIHLLSVFQHPIGTPVPYNPSFMCLAERVRHLPGIKTGKDYLHHARKLMEASQIQMKVADEVTTETLGGREFDVMNVEMSVAGLTISQKYYTSIQKGYALGFIVSYTTDEEEGALQEILDTVAFESSQSE